MVDTVNVIDARYLLVATMDGIIQKTHLLRNNLASYFGEAIKNLCSNYMITQAIRYFCRNRF